MKIRFTLSTFCILLSSHIGAQNYFQQVIGESDFDEYAAAVEQTASGSIYVMGHANSDSIGGFDLSLLKLDANGNLLWEKHYGTAQDDFCSFGTLTSDGDLIFGGEGDSTNGYGILTRTDTNGAVLWQQTYLTNGLETGFTRIAEGEKGNFYVSGFQTDTVYGVNNAYVGKIDSIGNMMWELNFGDTTNDYAQSIVFTPDTHCILAIDRLKPDAKYSVAIAKIDSAGNLVWDTSVPTNYNAGSQDIIVTADGNYLVVGESSTQSSVYFDVYLVKATPNGTIVWDTWVAATNKSEAGFAVYEEPLNGNLVITGYGHNPAKNENDLIFWETDSTGNPIGKSFYGSTGAVDIGYGIIPSVFGGYIMAGETNNSSKDYIIIYDSVPMPLIVPEISNSKRNFTIYPNPVPKGTRQLYLKGNNLPGKVTMFDIYGRKVFQQPVVHKNQVLLPYEIAPGTYFLQTEQNGVKKTAKVVIE